MTVFSTYFYLDCVVAAQYVMTQINCLQAERLLFLVYIQTV